MLSNTTAGRGQPLTGFPRKVLAGDATPDFPLWMGYRDLHLAMSLAASVGAPPGPGRLRARDVRAGQGLGPRDQDCTAMPPLLEDIARATHSGDPPAQRPA